MHSARRVGLRSGHKSTAHKPLHACAGHYLQCVALCQQHLLHKFNICLLSPLVGLQNATTCEKCWPCSTEFESNDQVVKAILNDARRGAVVCVWCSVHAGAVLHICGSCSAAQACGRRCWCATSPCNTQVGLHSAWACAACESAEATHHAQVQLHAHALQCTLGCSQGCCRGKVHARELITCNV